MSYVVKINDKDCDYNKIINSELYDIIKLEKDNIQYTINEYFELRDLNILNAGIDKLNTRIVELNDEIIELHQRMENLKSEVSNANAKVDHYEQIKRDLLDNIEDKDERNITITEILKNNNMDKHDPCWTCGGDMTHFKHQKGHVISKSQGGKGNIKNLKPICANCNSGMNTRPMNEWALKSPQSKAYSEWHK